MEFYPAWHAALNDHAKTVNSEGDKVLCFVASCVPFADPAALAAQTVYHLGFTGSFGAHRVSPRELSAAHLTQLMCVEGIVTRCGSVRPKVTRTVHLCDATGKYQEAAYHDQTSVLGFPTGSVYPTKVGRMLPLLFVHCC